MNDRKPAENREEEAELDLARLVGFASLESKNVDFRDETFAAKVGAKIGIPEPG